MANAPSSTFPSQRRSSAGSSSGSNLSELLSESGDPTLAALREKRLAELRAQAPASNTVAVNAPGYGAPAELAEAQAIQTTADAAASLLLFSHADMAACAQMRAHLDRISAAHTGVACVVVHAEQAAWLADRMGVRVLPVLIGLLAGKEVGRAVGFEGLERGLASTWRDVEARVYRWGVIAERARDDSADEDEDGELERGQERQRGKGKSIRSGGPQSKARTDDDDDSDWD